MNETRHEALQAALRLIRERADELLAEVVRVAELPAPTYHEERRAEYVEQRFRQAGLSQIGRDDQGSVFGVWPGAGDGPRLLVAAHLDTVFPPGTDTSVRIEGNVAHGPGIRDNSAAVAGLITLARVLRDTGLRLDGDLVLACPTGEEGLGNLRGMKALMSLWRDRVDGVIVFDGPVGGVVHAGVGSKRIKVVVRTEGGHSWADFGRPSAIHALCAAVAEFVARAQPPVDPRTTFNVGTIGGGTSVNSIAQHAEALIDMRSTSEPALQSLAAKADEIFRRKVREAGGEPAIEEVGYRPTGSIPPHHPLVRLVCDVHRQMGIESKLGASSTDANVPLSMGIPSVCIGSGRGAGTHTLQETLEIDSLVPGLQQLLRVLAAIRREHLVR